jgi:hypothetical protein
LTGYRLQADAMLIFSPNLDGSGAIFLLYPLGLGDQISFFFHSS